MTPCRQNPSTNIDKDMSFCISDCNHTTDFVIWTPHEEQKWVTAGTIVSGYVNFYPIAPNKLFKIFKEYDKIPVIRTVNTISNSSFMKVLHHVFDQSSMTCDVGLLCWIHVDLNNITNSSKRRPTCCVGFNVDLLIHLQNDLGIKFEIYQVRDMKFGAEVNGTWNGLIGDLVTGKADMTSATMAIMGSRAKVVDFSSMIFVGNVRIATVTNETFLSYINAEAFAPLTHLSWVMIFGLTVIGTIAVYGAERLVSTDFSSYGLSDAAGYMVGLLFQRDIGGANPHHLGSRAISVILAMAMMVLMTAYTAVLTARNIRFGRQLPITGHTDEKVRKEE